MSDLPCFYRKKRLGDNGYTLHRYLPGDAFPGAEAPNQKPRTHRATAISKTFSSLMEFLLKRFENQPNFHVS